MLVRELFGDQVRDVVSVGKKTPVVEAAQIMTEQQIGVVVVIDDDGAIAGIMSERDILAAVGEFDERFQHLTADQLMTEKVVTCSPDESISRAVLKLEALRIRHLVVVDRGEMYGVVSMRDVLEAFSRMTVRSQVFGRKKPIFELASALSTGVTAGP